MQRRDFLKKASLGAAAGSASVLAAPAMASVEPNIKWRLASSFPKSLDVLFQGSEDFCERVRQLTGGKFDIRAFPAGELVPGLQVLDATQAGTVELCHTAPYYFFGKNEAFCFDCAVPFGLTTRQQNAWMYYGGGMALMRDFYANYGVVNFLAGNTGCQMGGWFRKPINTLNDLKGLKMRIAGFAGLVLSDLGLVPQQIAPGDVYAALEKGTIDAAEMVGPADDEKLGLHKVAPYYYYPGWWEGSTATSLLVNKGHWEKLPKSYQLAFETAAAEMNVRVMANYDTRNPQALGRLIKSGAKLSGFSREIMEGCFKSANNAMEATAAKNPEFKKIYEPWKRFRNDQFQWFRVAEQAYAQFTFGKQFGKK